MKDNKKPREMEDISSDMDTVSLKHKELSKIVEKTLERSKQLTEDAKKAVSSAKEQLGL